MKPYHKHLGILIFALFLLTGLYSQRISSKISLRDSKGKIIVVENGSILINKKKLYKFQFDDILYSSKRNKIVENNGSTFLFLEIYGSPNLNRLYGFKISENKIDSVVDVVSSEIKDFDHDGFLEFGGQDLTEVYPSKDSMYYIPFDFYEIKNGKISYDSSYTKKKSIEFNGIYLLHPQDANGECCIVVKPKRKKNF